MIHALAVVAGYWCILYTVDRFLRTYRPFKTGYVLCQEYTGCTVSLAHVRFYTTKFNHLFKLWGACNRRWARTWFNVGVLVGVVLMVTSIVVLIMALYQALFATANSEKILTPIMPGVNIPWNELAYYFITLVVCGIFHEVGHALAAVTEQVRINGFGVFLFLIYPGAFVDLHPDHLTVISPRRQLRIYCAGVWHNIILSGLVLLLLTTLPHLLFPFYFTGEGATVVSLSEESVVKGKLILGDAITHVDSCEVKKTKEWLECLNNVLANPQLGYCVSNQLLPNRTVHFANQTSLTEEGDRKCCWHESQSDICFSVHWSGRADDGYMCLTARQVVNENICDESSCKSPEDVCVRPALAPGTHLLKISHTGKGDSVLFLGDPRLLQYSVRTSDYRPFSTSPLWLPGLIQTMCNYILSISSALALLNMVPAYALDGQWALAAILEMWMPESPYRSKIMHVVLIFGTALLVLNILTAIWILINW